MVSGSALKLKNDQNQRVEEIIMTKAKLAKLRKLNQLSLAKVEKSDKEVKGKLAEVERQKCQLQAQIRYSN